MFLIFNNVAWHAQSFIQIQFSAYIAPTFYLQIMWTGSELRQGNPEFRFGYVVQVIFYAKVRFIETVCFKIDDSCPLRKSFAQEFMKEFFRRS